MITVFTPTYNRAHLLPNLYKSLKKQTNKDFEWIIVDDDSTDNTQQVIKEFILDSAGFDIISLKQVHGGKHRAINLGVKHARTEWFFIVDSDDVVTEDAIEWIIENTIEAEKEEKICGISGTKILKSGKRIDGEILVEKNSYRDLFNLEAYKINASGDMAEIWKTQLLEKYPFPDYEGEYMCPESVIWGRMAVEGYRVRYFNKAIYIFEYLDDGLTRTSSLDRIYRNFHYFCDSYQYSLKYGIWRYRTGNFLNFNRVAHRKGITLKKRAELVNLKQSIFVKRYFLDLPLYIFYRFICKIFHI